MTKGNIDLARAINVNEQVRDFPASSGPSRLSAGVLNESFQLNRECGPMKAWSGARKNIRVFLTER